MRVLRSLAAVTLAVIPVVTVPFALRAQMAAPQHSNRIALEQYLDWEEVQAPQLSPDGTQILFGRRWVDKMNDRWESSVWLMNADGSHQRSLVQGSDVHWSPDGKRIAYVAKGEPSGQQIFVRWMDAEGAVTQISHLTESPASLEWSPDGKSIAFTMNVPVKETWRIAMPTPPKGAKWIESPKIVTRLNYRSDRVGFNDDAYRHIFLIPADGSGAHVLSGNLDRPISGVSWAPDGSGVYFNVESEGSKNLYFATPAGQFHPVTSGKQVLTVNAVGKTGVAVGIRSTPTKPNDVVSFAVPKTGTASTFTQLTAVNDDVLAGKELAQTEEIWYTSKDGLKVQGWVVKPPGFDPSKKYPLILDIHGGPQAMYNVAFSFARQDNAANGFVVLYTNPRGSTGYGEKFTNEIKNAYPGKDFDDLMAGVDTVVGRGYVDTKNMFVYGCSGGGVLTAWTVGHTNRFAAAASLCPVIDWISFVGETDGAGWYENFEKPFWEDPSEYLKRSPIMYVGNVKTPTLLMTGVLDLRTPIPQIEEFYRALKMHGTPTMMIRMNNEYHGTSSTPSNFLRTQLYVRGWFEKYGTMRNGAVTTTQDR
jgi:dipeptidyl aminopeptidase/acylaminoacyl peptidase